MGNRLRARAATSGGANSVCRHRSTASPRRPATSSGIVGGIAATGVSEQKGGRLTRCKLSPAAVGQDACCGRLLGLLHNTCQTMLEDQEAPISPTTISASPSTCGVVCCTPKEFIRTLPQPPLPPAALSALHPKSSFVLFHSHNINPVSQIPEELSTACSIITASRMALLPGSCSKHTFMYPAACLAPAHHCAHHLNTTCSCDLCTTPAPALTQGPRRPQLHYGTYMAHRRLQLLCPAAHLAAFDARCDCRLCWAM